MVPSTEKAETADDKLRADFQAFKDYESSDDLKHYLELEKEVTSSAFALGKKKILKEKYKASEAFRKEVRYDKLMKRSKGDDTSEELKNLEGIERCLSLIDVIDIRLEEGITTMDPIIDEIPSDTKELDALKQTHNKNMNAVTINTRIVGRAMADKPRDNPLNKNISDLLDCIPTTRK